MSDEELMEMIRTQLTSDPAVGAKLFARLQYCQTHNLKYHGLYSMPQAAVLLCEVSGATEEDVDTSSIKRWIKAGKLAYVRHGEKGVKFFGYQIADFHLNNVRGGWDGVERRKNSRSESGTYQSATGQITGTAAGSTQNPEPRFVSQLASGLTTSKARN